MPENAVAERHPWRLAGWLAFVLALTALNYAGRFLLDDGVAEKDVAYQWVSSVGIVFQYGLMLGILLLIAIGLPKRDVFALRRPASWKRAAGLAALVLLAIYAVAAAYTGLLSLLGDYDATEEQGLVPDEWDPSRAAPFVAFFVGVTVIAPIVEELTYRGLGISLARPYGAAIAVVTTGVLFGLAHGLLVGLPVLTFFGLAIGWLRVRTDSIYPPIALHATFNAVSLLAAVSGVG